MTEESEESKSRWAWLDRWFEPPWRALITWAGLAALMGFVMDRNRFEILFNAVDFAFDQFNRTFSTRLPYEMRSFAVMSNIVLIRTWFEPLALRLNLLRGLAWLGLRMMPDVFSFQSNPFQPDLIRTLAILACSAMSVVVLYGWRSRPWMAFISGAIMAGVDYCHMLWLSTLTGLNIAVWHWMLAMSLPNAVILLYGTRLLRSEKHRPADTLTRQ